MTLNNSRFIRQAAFELDSMDNRSVVKVASFLKRIVNWVKSFNDPEYKESIDKLKEESPKIKHLVDSLSDEISKLNSAIDNTDPTQYGSSLESLRPLINELAKELGSFDAAAAEATAKAPADGVMDQTTGIIHPESDYLVYVQKGYRENPDVMSKLQKQLPKELDVPISQRIVQPVQSFNWFKQFAPSDVYISYSAMDMLSNQIKDALVTGARGMSTYEADQIVDANINQIISLLQNNILNGILIRYTYPEAGGKSGTRTANQMEVVINAGTMTVPTTNIVLDFPLVLLNDKFASANPTKTLEFRLAKGIRYIRGDSPKVETPKEEQKEDAITTPLAEELDELDIPIETDLSSLKVSRKEIFEKFAAVERRLSDSEVSPQLSAIAKRVLAKKAPIGSKFTFSFGGKKYVAKIEEHYHPPGGKQTPWGKHPGVSLFALDDERASRNPAAGGSVAPGRYNSVVSIPGLENKSPEFIRELISIGNRLNIDPSFIASVMKSESGFNSKAVNPMGGATGLIQFMPSVAKNLGTSSQELKNMSDVEQLRYVEKFFQPYAGKIKTPGDLYMATFLPIFVGKPDDFIIGEKGNHDKISGNLTYDKVYTFNTGFDYDKDGIIRVQDVTGRANKIYAGGAKKGVIEGGNPSTVTPEQPVDKKPAEEQQEMIAQAPTQQEEFTAEDASDLFKFLYASAGPAERIVRRALYKQKLPTTRIFISIGSKNLPLHARVRYAKILTSALRTDLDAESSIHNYGDNIEIESDISGSEKNVLSAVKGLSEGISDAFTLSTHNQYNIGTMIIANASSSYALIDRELLDSSYRKLLFEMVGYE